MQNLFIEGDNLDGLYYLRKEYLNKIKMIYIDPPYNTGKRQSYNDKRTYDAWKSFMYPRLYLGRDLLRGDGFIFISIDDNMLSSLRSMCDEIFGLSNFMCVCPRVTKKGGKLTKNIDKNNDYIVIYRKTDAANLIHAVLPPEYFNLEDEFLKTRGRFSLSRTIDCCAFDS